MPQPLNPETKDRYAVCVGINQYDPSAKLPSLRYAEHDAQAIYELLLQKGFEPGNCRLLLGTEATREAIEDALTSFVLTKPRSDDLVLFYFAGHGLPIGVNDEDGSTKENDVFLIAHDFNLYKITVERGAWLKYPLRLSRLRLDVFEVTRSRKVLFLFDSCHSGDFYGLRYRGDEPLAHQIESAFAGMSAGRIVLSSCMPQQKAREEEYLQHGLFTYHLLEALKGNAPDAVESDGWVTVGSLFSYLSRTLPAQQCPVRSGVEHGTFHLLYYPEQRRYYTSSVGSIQKHERRRAEQQNYLKALRIDHHGFIQDRLSSFVGRERIGRDTSAYY